MATKGVILVGNKADLERRREISTNSKYNRFIQLFRFIIKIIDNITISIFSVSIDRPEYDVLCRVLGKNVFGHYLIEI